MSTAEHIVEAAWLSRAEIVGRTVFPPVLAAQDWDDRTGTGPLHLGLRHMDFW